MGNNGSVNLEREGDGEKMGEKERRGSQINVVKISSVAWLCLGIILGMADMKFDLRLSSSLLKGCTFGAPWTEDLLDLIRGYRWNRTNRSLTHEAEAFISRLKLSEKSQIYFKPVRPGREFGIFLQ